MKDENKLLWLYPNFLFPGKIFLRIQPFGTILNSAKCIYPFSCKINPNKQTASQVQNLQKSSNQLFFYRAHFFSLTFIKILIAERDAEIRRILFRDPLSLISIQNSVPFKTAESQRSRFLLSFPSEFHSPLHPALYSSEEKNGDSLPLDRSSVCPNRWRSNSISIQSFFLHTQPSSLVF